MSTLYMMKGLSGSGKSTKAAEMVLASKGKTKRINKDLLREMVDCGEWSKSNEKMIVQVRNELVRTLLSSNFDVIVDDTNLALKHQTDLWVIAGEHGAAFEVIDLTDVPLNECIERDSKRPKPVGKQVILKQWRDFLKPVRPDWKPEQTYGVLCDLDGTLALIGNRSPYDASQCHLDALNSYVYDHLCKADLMGQKVILVSGRSDKYREQTEQWLRVHGINFYDALYMRKDGDNRKDSIVKREIYEEHIAPTVYVVAVYDDRPQVIRMWRELALPVFDVGDGVEF